MKKRVKITKAPGGKPSMGDQMGYGLYRGQGVRDFEQFNPTDPSADLRTTYPETSRDKANIEVEKGEKIIAKDGMSIFDVGGKKHSQGGTPVKAEPGSYVVSDFIQAPKIMQAKMGFEVKSNKKKDNTWARVLDSKVKSRDYNRLSNVLQKAKNGMQVDPLELKTAEHKFPLYQEYVSKAALGGELSKAMMGKEYEIPQLGMPALQKMMGGQQGEGMPAQPQMGMGGYVLPKALGGLSVDEAEQANGGPGKKYKVKNREVNADFVVAPPSGYVQYDPNLYPELYWKQGQAGQSTPGSFTGGYNVPRGGNGNVSVNDILANPGKYKTFHKLLEGAPDDVKQKAAYDLWKTGKMPGKYVPGTSKPGVDDKFVYVEQPGTGGDGGGDNNKKKQDMDLGKKSDDTGGDSSSTGKTLMRTPYVEDILGVGNALRGKYAFRNVPPAQVRPDPAYLNPEFVNTDYANRLMQSQARTALENASLYAGSPQTLNARIQDVNAQLLPALGQSAMQAGAQNAQSAMAANQYNNQVYNQAAQADAAATNALIDKNAQFIYNVDKSKVMADDRINQNIRNMITNSGNTYLNNQRFPQMAFDPLSYETYFKSGTGLGLNSQASSGYGGMGGAGTFPTAQFKALKDQAISAGVDPTKADDYVWDILQRDQPRYRRTINPMTGMPGNYSMTGYGDFAGGGYGMMGYPMMGGGAGYYEDGGYIPEYSVGGWM